ncbi:MAG: MBL fold metallo-hydrolase [Anaerolineae bacterium]
MELTPYVSIVGSGGLGLSHPKDCHIYLVHDEKEGVLIDSGVGLQISAILEYMTCLGYGPGRMKTLFLTHAHADHAGGAAALSSRLDCQVAASATEADLVEEGDEIALGLVQAKYSGRYPAEYKFAPCKVALRVEEDSMYSVGRISIRPILTPGHTAGSVCYVTEFPDGSRGLFTGDTVFWGGHISLLNTPGSEITSYRESVQKFGRLRVSALFPGHHLWDLRRGQRHLDTVIERFRGSQLPPNASW